MRKSIILSIAALILLSFISSQCRAADMFVYFGTHVQGAGKGFSLAHFDTETGVLSPPQFLLESKAPAYFVIAPDGRHLYTCHSTPTFDGQPGGAVSAYSIDPGTAHLTLLNSALTGGADTSYISLDNTHRYALAANYAGGNIDVFAIKPDGSIGDRTAFIQHTGSSIDPKRQPHAFAHSIRVDPTNRFALVADLGLDKFFVYRFNEKDGTLTLNDPPFAAVKPGVGPRHFVFHPNGKWIYLITEMGSQVFQFAWDSEKGTLKELQDISALPADFKGVSACAEMDVHPSGKFLYASNRGHDSLAVFSIDPGDGHLELIQHIPTGGKTPRNFSFDPTAKWLLVTNHDSNNAVVFAIDQETGKLTQHGSPVSVPYPFCERFLPAPGK
jgi:6-phosphogluconolactonase